MVDTDIPLATPAYVRKRGKPAVPPGSDSSRHLPAAKVRAFIDFVVETLGDDALSSMSGEDGAPARRSA